MDAEARELFKTQCNEVRSILLLAEQRQAAFLASRSSAKMPSGVPRIPTDTVRVTTPSDLHSWIMSVQIAARHVGRNGAFIMYARLCRRQRSAESSWDQIAYEADMAVADVKQAFQLAVPLFLRTLDKKGVTAKYAVEREIDFPRVEVTQLPDRCLASEMGESCKMAAA